VALHLTARLASFVDDPDEEVLFAGVAEHPDGSGWSLTFQGGSPDPDEATDDEEYCLVTETGAGAYGQVTAVVLDGSRLRLTLTRQSAADLALHPRIDITLDTDTERIDRFRDGLARIFTATSIDSRPGRLVLPGSHPPVQARPLLRRRRPPRGTRVEYVITGRRGDLLTVEAVNHPPQRHTEVPAILADQLGVDPATLVGRRYSCLVVTDRFGITMSDFQLIPN
jgi:hypothetical protein